MEIFLILAGVGIALFVVMNIRLTRSRNAALFYRRSMDAIFKAHDIPIGGSEDRDMMDAIFKAHDLPIDGSEDRDSVEREVTALSQWIGMQSLRRSTCGTPYVDDDDRFVAMLFTLVAADHLSRLGAVSFETNSALACIAVNDALGGGLVPNLVWEVIHKHQEMAADPSGVKLLQPFGNCVAAFIESGDAQHLDVLGQRFTVMREHLGPAT